MRRCCFRFFGVFLCFYFLLLDCDLIFERVNFILESFSLLILLLKSHLLRRQSLLLYSLLLCSVLLYSGGWCCRIFAFDCSRSSIYDRRGWRRWSLKLCLHSLNVHWGSLTANDLLRCLRYAHLLLLFEKLKLCQVFMKVAKELIFLCLFLDPLLVPSLYNTILSLCVIHKVIVVYWVRLFFDLLRGSLLQDGEGKVDLSSLIFCK